MTAEADPTPETGTELPADVVEEAARLTRLARNAVDENEVAAHRERRAALLAEYEFTARLRTDDHDETLVLHPAEWVADGVVDVERIEDVSRAVEVPLDGTDDPDDWEAVEAHNREIAARIQREHGPVHGATAHAFADFMGNHYARPIEDATPATFEEFRTEYFPRNAWPTDEQRDALEASLELLREER